MVADTRMRLTAAYGTVRIAELMMFVDAMFAKLTAEERIPVAGPTQ
jgi:hypothetical protein